MNPHYFRQSRGELDPGSNHSERFLVEASLQDFLPTTLHYAWNQDASGVDKRVYSIKDGFPATSQIEMNIGERFVHRHDRLVLKPQVVKDHPIFTLLPESRKALDLQADMTSKITLGSNFRPGLYEIEMKYTSPAADSSNNSQDLTPLEYIWKGKAMIDAGACFFGTPSQNAELSFPSTRKFSEHPVLFTLEYKPYGIVAKDTGYEFSYSADDITNLDMVRVKNITHMIPLFETPLAYSRGDTANTIARLTTTQIKLMHPPLSL